MKLIKSDPNIMMGKPVIEGTRITVESILEALGAGESFEQITSSHSKITREAILAAIGFGAKALKADVVYPVPGHAA